MLLLVIPFANNFDIVFCRQIQDPASQRLTWYKAPLAVLVIKKARDHTVLPPFIQLVEWLIKTKNMVVWVEEAVLDDQVLLKDNMFQTIKDKLITFRQVHSYCTIYLPLFYKCFRLQGRQGHAHRPN